MSIRSAGSWARTVKYTVYRGRSSRMRSSKPLQHALSLVGGCCPTTCCYKHWTQRQWDKKTEVIHYQMCRWMHKTGLLASCVMGIGMWEMPSTLQYDSLGSLQLVQQYWIITSLCLGWLIRKLSLPCRPLDATRLMSLLRLRKAWNGSEKAEVYTWKRHGPTGLLVNETAV